MGQNSSSQDKEEKKLMQRHKIDKSELESLRKLFRERCGGKHKALTKKKFREVYNELFPGKSTQYADEMFRLFDMDGNGEVDFIEFVRNICMCDSDDVDEKIEVAFALYDKDNSKTITQTEVKNMLEVGTVIIHSFSLLLPREMDIWTTLRRFILTNWEHVQSPVHPPTPVEIIHILENYFIFWRNFIKDTL